MSLPFSSLQRLQGLTHCRISLDRSSALSSSSLIFALSSIRSLTDLELGAHAEAWPQLLPLLCSDAATPLLLRLQSLVLPDSEDDSGDEGSFDEQHDAFLCRLSSLPAPPALQRFRAMSQVSYRPAGLQSVFSLPHLRLLTLPGVVRLSELFAFVSSFTSTPAPLVSLMLPNIQFDPEDDDEDEDAVAANAEAAFSAVRRLLSRLTALRDLTCDADVFSGAGALPDSLASDAAGGCSRSLYDLTLERYRSPRVPCAHPLSFSLLTVLDVRLPMADAELELLLSGCPQLRVLGCRVQNSWTALLVAARRCRRLLDVRLWGLMIEPPQAGDVASAPPEFDVGGSFLPELVSLALCGDAVFGAQPPVWGFSVLPHFTCPPHAALRRVCLEGAGLSAERVLSLACLPQLSHLEARRKGEQGGSIAELNEAVMRAQQQLPGRGRRADADRDSRWPVEMREDCEVGFYGSPLFGPHQQREIRQSLLQELESCHCASGNLLASVGAVDADTARAVFFAELRSVLASKKANRKRKRK